MTLTQEELKSNLEYNKDSGVFTWVKSKPGPHAKEGKEAGNVFNSFVRIGLNGRVYSSHRLAWLYIYGYIPKRLEHIDGNKVNNRIDNLRETSWNVNKRNYN